MPHNHLNLAALAASLALIAFTVGCGDEAAAPTMAAPSNGTTSNGTTSTSNGTTSTSNGTTATASPTLERIGDFERAANANSSLDLEVLYKDGDGNPGSGKIIEWEIIGEANGTLLDSLQSPTDGDGVAKMTVRSSTMEARFEVEARVVGEPDVGGIRFDVSVQSKNFASYRVVVNYDGQRVYTNNNIKAILFDKATLADANEDSSIDCKDINYLRLVGAFRSEQRRPDASWPPMSYIFDNLANGTTYIAVAVAFADGNDQVVGSWGCNDDAPAIADGINPPDVVVTMDDVLPQISGTWEIESTFDLTEALPGSVLTYLDPILDFFNDPAGTLITLLLDFVQEQFGLDIGSVRSLVENIAGELVERLLEQNNTIAGFLNAGGDIGEILRNFRLQGSVVISDDMIDRESGLISAAAINYTRFGYRWRLLCEEGEFDENPSCGDRVVDFGNVGLTPALGVFDGAVFTNPDYNIANGRIWFHQLAIQDHSLDLNYGQIVLYMIEKLALPALTGDPSIDSLSALLASFIICEDDPNNPDPDRREGLFDEGSLFATVCEAGIAEVSNLATGFLSDQSLNYERFLIKTPDTNPCAMYEQDDAAYGAPQGGNTAHNPKFKLMGKNETHPEHGDRRCEWEANIQFSEDPADATQFTGQFHAEKLFD